MNKKPDPDSLKRKPNYDTYKIIEDFKLGKVSTLSFCLGCYDDKVSQEHPIFLGYFCIDCTDRFKKNFYKTNKCGKMSFCTICVFSGTMITCQEDKCKFVYCIQCIQDLTTTDAYEKLQNKKMWFCFVCHENKNYRGALSVKFNWKGNVQALLAKDTKFFFSRTDNAPEQELFTLKLRNGIKSIMEMLKKKRGIYYSNDAERNYIKITENNYPEVIKLFTSSKELTSHDYHKIVLVNLLICSHQKEDKENEIGRPSVVLYEFHRVLKCLEECNKPFYWIFEWDGNISLQKQVIVTRLLQSSPLTIGNYNETDKTLIWTNLTPEAVDTDPFQKNILFTDPRCYLHKE